MSEKSREKEDILEDLKLYKRLYLGSSLEIMKEVDGEVGNK